MCIKIYDDNAIIMAPLAGYTDLPYRHALRRHGFKYCFTEMVDAGSVAYGNERGLRYLERAADEPWLGVQLVGSDHERMRRAIDVLNRYNFDAMDFNLGCPVPKVAKKGAGAILGRNVEAATAAFEIVHKYSNKPVTAKIRIINEEDPTETIRLVKNLAEVGANAVTIHGRVMKKYYSGDVFVEIIKACNEAVDIPIIANGGVMNYQQAQWLREQTNCDKIMVARGAMGNPWLYEEIMASRVNKRFFNSELEFKDSFKYPTAQEVADEMKTHVYEMAKYYGEDRGLILSRKIVLDYFRGRGFNREIKSNVSTMKTLQEFDEIYCEMSKGPTPRYWQWRETKDAQDRLMCQS
ncbi:tRNA-dihydrouridine synthase family protein [Lentisphaerota bacterium WC36G]|nr:tRNA-dihydrouridine synthase family protein [Lentisphaerae bacterium WC36]